MPKLTQLLNGGVRYESSKIFFIYPSRPTVHPSLLIIFWTAYLSSLAFDVATGRQRWEPGAKGEWSGGICPQLPLAVLQFASGCASVASTAIAPSSGRVYFRLQTWSSNLLLLLPSLKSLQGRGQFLLSGGQGNERVDLGWVLTFEKILSAEQKPDMHRLGAGGRRVIRQKVQRSWGRCILSMFEKKYRNQCGGVELEGESGGG